MGEKAWELAPLCFLSKRVGGFSVEYVFWCSLFSVYFSCVASTANPPAARASTLLCCPLFADSRDVSFLCISHRCSCAGEFVSATTAVEIDGGFSVSPSQQGFWRVYRIAQLCLPPDENRERNTRTHVHTCTRAMRLNPTLLAAICRRWPPVASCFR